MVCFMIIMGSWCLTTNDDDIKECDAPESNKTVVGCDLARNIQYHVLSLLSLFSGHVVNLAVGVVLLTLGS
jgi:hypothetical protein